VRWGVFLLLVIAFAGCKRERQLSGVGPWNVNRTQLRDATGRCVPDDSPEGKGMYCFGQKPMGIRGMVVDLDLFFGGTEPDAKLIEIQMKVGGCDDEQLYGWMQTNFGKPVEDRGSHKLWKSTFLWAVAAMPRADEPGRCLVRHIPAREKSRFDRAWPPAP
jgi:hypothetical protein